jgi:hypothetical protein
MFILYKEAMFMAYNFKSIADVEVVAEPTESANVLIEENGEVKKAPKTAVGGANKWDAVIEYYNDDDFYIKLISGDYKTIYNKIMVEKEIPQIKVISTYNYYGPWHGVSSASAMYHEGNDYITICFCAQMYYSNDQTQIYLYSDNSIED